MFSYDWMQVYKTKEALNEDLGLEVERAGWYITKKGNDHLLALYFDEADYWIVYVWNGRDPRPRLQEIAALPSFPG